MRQTLSGSWTVVFPDGTQAPVMLPGTLDENGLGTADTGGGACHPDEEGAASTGAERITTRLTRRHVYEGPVRFRRRVRFLPPEGKRIFVYVERARHLRLSVNGQEVAAAEPPTVSTPYLFEVTEVLTGDDWFEFLSDNSYPGWPHDAIVFSSAATDETQTNWNGILGEFRLEVREPVFFRRVSVYPCGQGTLRVVAEISAGNAYQGALTLCSAALAHSEKRELCLEAGEHTVCLEGLEQAGDLRCWDEGEGNLYSLEAALSGAETLCVRFGVRTFGVSHTGRLMLNGRDIFLRGETNCAVFPATGYPPMTVAEWENVLEQYRSYGVNFVRFHSHCPPEAAFEAADRMGMLMEPELSQWNPKNALEDDRDFAYYTDELKQVLRMLANHPSFVMLTFGNELQTGDLGHDRMESLLAAARKADPTRLYANGSNTHYGRTPRFLCNDFFTAQAYWYHRLRGTFSCRTIDEQPGLKGYINTQYPGTCATFEASVSELRKEFHGPVFGFEVGQYEVLPDFSELPAFDTGVTAADNLLEIRERAHRRGLLENWDEKVEASGELALLAYREEVEAALRTQSMSGLVLLGLQDFPGQGTALVGMMNSHLEPKPFRFAQPQAFRSFFRAQLPLAIFPKYTYEAGEMFRAQIKMANYGREALRGTAEYRLDAEGAAQSGTWGSVTCEAGGLTEVGTVELALPEADAAVCMKLTVSVCGMENSYPVWVYPRTRPVCPENVWETEYLDDRALEKLAQGGTVYLSPHSTKEALPQSIQGEFTTDFWSVGTFPKQEGGMGQKIEASHPLFRNFPTQKHTNWQWWIMARQRAMILPRPMKAIVEVLDNIAFLRPMAQLLECRCAGGRLLISSLGLQDLGEYPEARALQQSIYRYLEKETAVLQQEMTVEEVRALVAEVRLPGQGDTEA